MKHQRRNYLFSDIRSFTDMSEKMTQEENFKFLNNYLRFIGPVIGRSHELPAKPVARDWKYRFGQKNKRAGLNK